MRIQRFAVLAFVVMLAACAVLPTPRTDQSTLLIVPVDFERTATVEIYGRCKLHVLSDEGRDIDTWVDATPGVSFKPRAAFPPGRYKVSEMCFVYYEDNELTKPYPIKNLYFETQAGRITVLPMMVQYTIQKHSGRYKYMFHWNLKALTQAKAKEVLARMMKDKNYGAWKLGDQTLKNPVVKAALAEL